ncbi:MAG TPA: hypothetical protein VN673_17140, partial [Clostridia bacterium]|nr:hypothetical protein [Clostridia bacterium]
SYLGTMTISEGTLRAGSGTALGDTNVATTIANGATLDINTQNLGMEPVFAQGAGVGGAGAIVNNGTDQQQALRFVTLTGPTTIGGASRWDLRNPVIAEADHAWLRANGHKLTKVSSNVISFISIGDTGMGDMDIQDGTITLSRSTSFGNPAGTVTLWPNAHLQFHRLDEFIVNPFNKKIAMTNAFIAVESNGLTNTLAGTIQMSGSNIFTMPTTTTGLRMDNAVSGNSSLVIVGPGALILNGNATHTGGTIVNNAIMTVNGTLGPSGQPLTLLGGNTLAGHGTIRDAVTLPLGSILSPGEGDIGSLNISAALVLQAGGVTHIEYNKDMGTNDNVRGLSSVAYGGTLVLTNTGFTTLVPGDSLKLFYAGSYSGAFDSIVPAVPASGLKWNTSSLAVNGTLSVVLDPSVQPPMVYSVSSLVSNSLNVIFNLEVEDATALDPSNYILSTGQNAISAIKVTPNNILLTLDVPITAPTYSVQVKNVRNTAFVPLTIATTNVPGVAHGFANSMGVGIFDGFAFAYGTNKIHVFASGSDIFNTQDQFQFTWREVTGDFDVSVNLHYLLDTDPAAKAGLMARDIADASFPLIQERNIMIAGFPGQGQGRNQNLFQYREEQGGASVAPAAPRPAAAYPDNWLRLKRKGSMFWSMVSSNNLDWSGVNAVDTSTNTAGALPATLRVGLAVTAHNATAGVLTEAIYSNLGAPQERPKLTMVYSTNAVNVLELSWPSWIAGTYKLQSTASLTPPIVWNDVPGTLTTNFTTHAIGAGPAFFRLAP